MSDNTHQIVAELDSLGYETSVFDSPYGRVVCFPYTIDVGPHKRTPCTLGLSLYGAEHYPEHPPHWIHITPPIDDGKGGAVYRYEHDGSPWIALSRPPEDLWDTLPTKSMYAYMYEHVRRFWANCQG